MHPSQSFLTELRTFIPLVCPKAVNADVAPALAAVFVRHKEADVVFSARVENRARCVVVKAAEDAKRVCCSGRRNVRASILVLECHKTDSKAIGIELALREAQAESCGGVVRRMFDFRVRSQMPSISNVSSRDALYTQPRQQLQRCNDWSISL